MEIKRTGDFESKMGHVSVIKDEEIKEIFLGCWHTFILKDRTILVCGMNKHGLFVFIFLSFSVKSICPLIVERANRIECRAFCQTERIEGDGRDRRGGMWNEAHHLEEEKRRIPRLWKKQLQPTWN